MKKLTLLVVSAIFFLTFQSCSDSNAGAPASETQKLSQYGTIDFGPLSIGALERENYRRATDPGTIVFTGEMVRMTDNNHLIPVVLPGTDSTVILADMLDNDGLYADFQTALTRISDKKPVTVQVVIQDNTWKKDKFVVTAFGFPADTVIAPIDTIPAQPIIDTMPIVKPYKPFYPAKTGTAKKKDCGCCSTIVNATTATVTVNNGTAIVDTATIK